MTPSPSSSSVTSAGPKSGVVFGVGIVLGLLAGTGGGSLASYALVKREEARVRRGWNLVPVVVAGTTLAPTKPLEMEMISQRSVPEQLVTASIVKPDSAAYVIHQPLRRPLQEGAMIRWDDFLTLDTACLETIREKAKAHPSAATWQLVGGLRRRLPEPEGRTP
jgi:pilus assembly protein CpaB